jgi:hypothetical protein
MPTVARRLLTLLCLSTLLVGCGTTIDSPAQTVGPAVQFATGGSDAGTWTAVIYTGQGGGTCMEFRCAGGRKGGSCGPAGLDFVTRDAEGIWIIGSTKFATATTVRVQGANGSAADTDAILPAPVVTEGVRSTRPPARRVDHGEDHDGRDPRRRRQRAPDEAGQPPLIEASIGAVQEVHQRLGRGPVHQGPIGVPQT